MSDSMVPALSGFERRIFELAMEVTEAAPYAEQVVITHNGEAYLLDTGFRGDSLGATSKADLALLSAARSNSADWNDFDFPPKMFKFAEFQSRDRYTEAARALEHDMSFSIAVTDGHTEPNILTTYNFPSWGQQPSRDFFKKRDIRTGYFHCNSLMQAAIDIVLRPEDLLVVDFEGSETHGANQLVHEAQDGAFVLNFALTQRLGENTPILVRQLERIQQFLFQDLDSWLFEKNRHTPFGVFLAQILEVDEAEAFIDRLGFFEPFDSSGRLGSNSDLWLKPDAIRISVETPHIDASFGTVTSNSWSTTELYETRANWLNVNFGSLNPSAYLKRLQTQARSHPAESR